MATPAIDKSGDWMVIVTTDSRGRVFAYPHQGRDQDEAFRKIEQKHAGGRWLVHWEKGYKTQADAEARARAIELELKNSGNTAGKQIN